MKRWRLSQAVLWVSGLLAGLALGVVLILPLGGAWAQDAPEGALVVGESAAAAPSITFQGRLLDPASGQPKPDGSYNLAFRLYTVAGGGTSIWNETQAVTTVKGAFAVLLGSVSALNPAHFNGQELWIGVTAGSDAEMSPRQKVGYVPYAIYAGNAGALGGLAASSFSRTTHGHATLPIAYGFINANGGVSTATPNVTSAWNAGYSRYEIGITGHDYMWDDYVTTVTPSGSCEQVTGSTNSVGGKLLVQFKNPAGAYVQCPFQFVTFKP
jgi:hypothetical protein